jgi:hypothetical protein
MVTTGPPQDTTHLIKFLVEPAWLAYEDPEVVVNIAQKWAGLVGKPDAVEVITLSYVSTVFKVKPKYTKQLAGSNSGVASLAHYWTGLETSLSARSLMKHLIKKLTTQ